MTIYYHFMFSATEHAQNKCMSMHMHNKNTDWNHAYMYANEVSFRGPCGSQTLCLVMKVVSEKFNNHNGEMIMCTGILD